MFGFFRKKAEKKELDLLKQAVQTGFNSAKSDINKLNSWIKHLNTENSNLKYQIYEVQENLSRINEEIEEIRNKLQFLFNRPFIKQRQTLFSKQTVKNDVLNNVQTDVQTAFLNNLSITERAIVFVLLNSDMKLSYEDLASMLGKKTATIRGQINAIRQKSEGLIEEIICENNKKRVYIPDEIKQELLKSKKMKNKKDKKFDDYYLNENQI
ncbi:MAG: hypothetical protein QXW97_00170 [Candidatus Pacearchaeota archaeon]